jgi:hypothetical protein
MARPVGSKNKFSIHDFAKEKDAREFLNYVKKNYKKSDKLATWYGDHLFGKAPQPLTGADGGALIISFDNTFSAATSPSARHSTE